MDKAVVLKDVWVKYRIDFKEDGKVVHEDFWALQGVNLEINKGDVIAIIGENGAGKTTILKLIAGMLKPDRGTVEVNGRVSALMEIGEGFQRELTGKENIYLIASMHGLRREQIDQRCADIIKFADIGRFINAPVKSYSQGMYMRLAFAISIYLNSDIILIDDVFAVGDVYAQRKCIDKIFGLKKEGKMLVFVSQDIELAKRLCANGIFIRNGAIVSKGEIGEVCNYYLETVGDKDGIALLKNGCLGLIFNNGRFMLRWKDKAITKDNSWHTVMVCCGRRYVSTSASWQIAKNERNKIIVIGKWPDISISQTWKVSVLGEEEFVWNISLVVDSNTLMDKFQINTVFSNEYSDWFTLDTKSTFPVNFIYPTEWEINELGGLSASIVGLNAGCNGDTKLLPTIILDRICDDGEMFCCVGNTGLEAKGRVVQYSSADVNGDYKSGSYRLFSAKVKVFDKNMANSLIRYIDNSRKLLQEFALIRKDEISLFCGDRKIEIYWQDKLISAGVGLHTKFGYRNTIYSSSDGIWTIRKKNGREIYITISWGKQMSLSQIWKLELQDDGVLTWEIDLESNEELEIRNKATELELSVNYQRWQTEEECGDFSRLEKKGQAVILNKYINECIGVMEAGEPEHFLLPRVSFVHDDMSPKVSYIFKLNGDNKLTRLEFLDINLKENLFIDLGRHSCFKGRVIINSDFDKVITDDKRLSVGSNMKKEASGRIGLKNIALVFANGKYRLFWNNVELTKGLGLYSSFLSDNRWHDSSQAYWDISVLDSKELKATGHWPWVYLTQHWDIKILDDKTLYLRIVKNDYDNTIFEKEHVGLMLSDRYQEWFVGKEKYGRFPELFKEHNGVCWDRLWQTQDDFTFGVRRHKTRQGIFNRMTLPSLVFQADSDCKARYAIIENTDNLYESRVLQYEIDSGDKRKLSERYFECRIRINV